MRAGNLSAFRKGFRRAAIILQIHVVNKSQVVIEVPFLRIVLNAKISQLDRLLRESCAVGWFRRKEVGSEFICHDQLRIESGCNLEQRRQQGIAVTAIVMLAAKILDGSGPINISQQTVISQAQSL